MKNFKMIFIFILLVSFLFAQSKRPMAPEDLYKINKVADPRVSPDGKWIAYTVSVPDLAANNYNSDIWVAPFEGGKAKQLTNNPGSDYSPRWSPEGIEIAFISNRDGIANLYLINVNGGQAKKLTSSETGLELPVWSSDGKYIICESRKLPEGKKDIENWSKDELPACNARTINQLLFRQWDRWLGDERNHILLVDIAAGSLKDLTPGDFDNPPVSLSSNHDFDISPDGKEICFVRNSSPRLAESTNHDLYILDVATMKEKKITTNPALDSRPHYSPDGKYITYAAMEKAGYESDRKCLVIYNRENKIHKKITEGLDRSVDEIVWSPDSKKIFFTARDEGRSSIYHVDLNGVLNKLNIKGFNTETDISPDGKTLVFLHSTNKSSNEIYTMSVAGEKVTQLTFTNSEFLKQIDLSSVEEFWFEGAENTKVHAFIQKPPNFDPTKKYPVVLTIHGGPQGMWADRFMMTWFNFQLIASQGYVGLFVNPRGSSGYGSEFREQVSRDYGGRCYQDLIKGLDYAIQNYDYIDESRQAAIGGSFGGFSVNWMMGRTDRFKCIVSHAGVYNMTSFFGATEELWYPEWDMGESPWEEPALYEKWSPHKYAKNFKTPTLVIHGEFDFRVPFGESLQLFTALQKQNIPSRLVVFPDEGHIIEKPQNNIRWWKEIHRWFKEYLSQN